MGLEWKPIDNGAQQAVGRKAVYTATRLVDLDCVGVTISGDGIADAWTRRAMACFSLGTAKAFCEGVEAGLNGLNPDA